MALGIGLPNVFKNSDISNREEQCISERNQKRGASVYKDTLSVFKDWSLNPAFLQITEARSEGSIELKLVRKPPKVSRGCGGVARAALGPGASETS